jgi:hypothetical protein
MRAAECGKENQAWNRGTCDMTSTISTARCGPVCRVVWEGYGLRAVPYPDRCYIILRERSVSDQKSQNQMRGAETSSKILRERIPYMAQ